MRHWNNIFVDHIELRVVDMARSLEFYSKFLGFEVLSMRMNRIELTADGKKPIVTLLHEGLFH